MAIKMVRVFSSVRAISQSMSTMMGLHILQGNNDDRGPGFSDALPDGVSWEMGSKRKGAKELVVTCTFCSYS